jgi:hypothetical protein
MEKPEVWMSSSAIPCAISASRTASMVALFSALASCTELLTTSTPMLARAMSGLILTVPSPTTVIVWGSAVTATLPGPAVGAGV